MAQWIGEYIKNRNAVVLSRTTSELERDIVGVWNKREKGGEDCCRVLVERRAGGLYEEDVLVAVSMHIVVAFHAV